MPPLAVQALAELLTQINSLVAWPAQALMQRVLLTPKSHKDDRPLSMMPTLCRIWQRIHKGYFQEWAESRSGPWDAA
eukprot:6799982-Alexandrium_andersonii.AAC.1